MRRVLFIGAAESAAEPDDLIRLRSDSTKVIEIVQPPESSQADALLAWISREGPSLDLAVISFSPLADSVEGGLAPATGVVTDRCVLNKELRARLLQFAPAAVAVGDTLHAHALPPDLKKYRPFDVSTPDGYDALLCRVVHSRAAAPEREGTHEKRFKASVGAFQILMGIVATIIGTLDRTRDWLVALMGDRAGLVHYLMIVVVIVLLLSGVVALVWPFIEPYAARIADTKRPRLKRAAVAGAAGIVLVFSILFLPSTPTVERLVEKHTQEWTTRITESQMAAGAFREHHDKGVAQTWLTSQALTALMFANPKALSAEDYGRAFAFLRRTRIGPFEVTPDARQRFETATANANLSIDLTRFPARLPTVAFGYDLLALYSRTPLQELPERVVQGLDVQQSALVTGSPSNDGWGYFAQFEWGVTEIAGWVAVATSMALRESVLSPADQAAARELLRGAISAITPRQLRDGGFSPIANTSEPSFTRTYSTAMALWGLSEASRSDLGVFTPDEIADMRGAMTTAVSWLRQTSVPGKGWKQNPLNPAGIFPIGLTAQVLCVLDRLTIPLDTTSEQAFRNIRRGLLQSASTWAKRDSSDPLLNDRIHDSDRYLFPTTYVTEGSTFLWYPWSVALMNRIRQDTRPEFRADADAAGPIYAQLRAKVGEFDRLVSGEYNYLAAEALIGLSWPGTSGSSNTAK